MSLGIIIKAPEGIVLAAESRVTLTNKVVMPDGSEQFTHVNFDNAKKVLTFSHPYDKIGVVTYGQAAIGFRTAQTFIPEFETTLIDYGQNLNTLQFAEKLSDFFMAQWLAAMPQDYRGPNMTMHVAGFDDNEPYGRVYTFDIPRNPKPIERNPAKDGVHEFGITWGGQREIVDRLILGYDSRVTQLLQNIDISPEQRQLLTNQLSKLSLPMPIQFMPLQDCVDLAILFIKTTINAQKLTVQLRGCGGPIDVAIITRNNPLKFIQEKQIKGDY